MKTEQEALVAEDVDPERIKQALERSIMGNLEMASECNRLRSLARPSKADAAKLAGTTIDEWIRRRSVALHRDARYYLIEAIAEAFGAPEVKEAEGIS